MMYPHANYFHAAGRHTLQSMTMKAYCVTDFHPSRFAIRPHRRGQPLLTRCG